MKGELFMSEINGPKRGVFWAIQKKLFAFPFEEGKYPEVLAKSKVTYTHKKLWRIVCPKGCGKAYHYYPRGRGHIAKRCISISVRILLANS